MIPTSTIPSLQKKNSVPTNSIAPKLPYVRNPRVSSLKHLPPNDIYTNETYPDNRNTNLVIASKQTPKTYNTSLRKRLSSSHLPTSTNILGTDTYKLP